MRGFIFIVVLVGSTLGYNSVLFQQIKTLTLYKDRLTTGQRTAPIRQIKCVGGDACNYFTPEVISCTNLGNNDMGNVQWKCQAQMEKSYRFGRTKVSCEGYSFKGDQNVLQGSCGVEYTLHLTERGKKKHLRRISHKSPVTHHKPRHHHYQIYDTLWTILYAICIAACLMILVKILRTSSFYEVFCGIGLILLASFAMVLASRSSSSSSWGSDSSSDDDDDNNTYTSTGWGGSESR